MGRTLPTALLGAALLAALGCSGPAPAPESVRVVPRMAPLPDDATPFRLEIGPHLASRCIIPAARTFISFDTSDLLGRDDETVFWVAECMISGGMKNDNIAVIDVGATHVRLEADGTSDLTPAETVAWRLFAYGVPVRRIYLGQADAAPEPPVPAASGVKYPPEGADEPRVRLEVATGEPERVITEAPRRRGGSR